MTTKPTTRKPTPQERSLARELLLIVVGNLANEILDADDGEVARKLVHEVYEIERAFHAHEVAA